MYKLLIFLSLLFSVESVGAEIDEIIKRDLSITLKRLKTSKDKPEIKTLKLLIQIIKLARPICDTEHINCANVIGDSGSDFGYFQIHSSELNLKFKNVKDIKKIIMLDPYLQYTTYKIIMLEKYEQCKDKYPKTWYACYHSKTNKNRIKYLKKLEKNIEEYINERSR